jgi:hypothetical protein
MTVKSFVPIRHLLYFSYGLLIYFDEGFLFLAIGKPAVFMRFAICFSLDGNFLFGFLLGDWLTLVGEGAASIFFALDDFLGGEPMLVAVLPLVTALLVDLLALVVFGTFDAAAAAAWQLSFSLVDFLYCPILYPSVYLEEDYHLLMCCPNHYCLLL